MRNIFFFVILGLFTVAFADLGVLVETDKDTVMKVRYSGSTPNSAHPAATVGGKRIGLVVQANNVSGARALTGVAGTSPLPDPGSYHAGVLGAGYYGIMGKGAIGIFGEGDPAVRGQGGWTGVYGTGGSTGVWGFVNAQSGAIGVKGESQATSGIGVQGIANVSSGIGVSGTSSTNTGIGVKGVASHSSWDNVGVYGEVGGSGRGVVGDASNWGWAGVEGSGGYNGVIGYANNTYYGGIGVLGEAGGDGNENVGVKGISQEQAGSGTNIGVYGYATGGSYGSYAGYFNGDVIITGSCTGCSASDQNLKRDIQDLTGSLGKIMAMRLKSYRMRSEDFQGRLNLSKRQEIGLLAQDLEQVLPEAVHHFRAPIHLTAEEKRNRVSVQPQEFKAVNYHTVIPILVQAIQEQQALIEDLQRRLGGQ